MSNNQVVRVANKPESYYETLKRRINAGKAAEVLKKMLDGEEVTAQQEKAALFVLNKFLPNLQAIAVQTHNEAPVTREDIESLALENNIPLAMIWKAVVNQELSESVNDAIDHELPEKTIT